MFFVLSKTISYLILPVSLLSICLLIFLLSRRQKLRKLALSLFVLLFFLFTNPFLSNLLMRWWEYEPRLIRDLQAPYDAAIILTGVTLGDMKPYDRVHLDKGADRIMHTVQLYKEGLVNTIIVSGGSGLLLEEVPFSEAEQIYKVLVLSGVSEQDILLEKNSRNTYENAQNTAHLLANKGLSQGRLLLITSAFHMRRAYACFQKAGLQPEPYSTDFYSREISYTPDALIIPSDYALALWTRLFREWTGYLVYGALGYL